MANVVRLSDVLARRQTRKPPRVMFDRRELEQLLAVYSRKVAGGQWRDYAIDHGRGLARFAVFRSTHEHPLFTIVKLPPTAGRRTLYLVCEGQRVVREGADLAAVLRVFQPGLSLVSP